MTKAIQQLMVSQKDQISLALPKHVDPGRMLRICLTEIKKNPKLGSCDPISFLGAVIQCSQLGLEPGSGLGQAYLIPFGKEVNMVVGYQGLIDLAMRSGKTDSIIADCVYTDDDFDFYTDGRGQHIMHKPNLRGARAEKDILIVYAMAQIKDGGSVIAWMTREEIETHKKKHSKGGSAWKDAWSEMAKKTVIRRLYKFLPKSIEMRDIVEKQALHDSNISQNNAAVITKDYDDLVQIEEKPLTGKSAEDMAKLNAELDKLGQSVEAAEERLKK